LSPLIPSTEAQRLLAEVEQLVQDDQVDFSFLPVDSQERMLREIARASGPKLESFRAGNAVVLSRIEQLIAAQMQRATAAGPFNTEKVTRRFGPAAYAAGFKEILDSFGETQLQEPGSTPSRRSGTEQGIAAGVLQRFLRLDQLRLLYDY
jgi:hypothetical protein